MSAKQLHILKSIILVTKIKWVIGIENNTSIPAIPLVVSDGQEGDISSL